MQIYIRPFRIGDAADLAATLNNTNVQDNLKDGFPYPYAEADASGYIQSVLFAERDTRYDFAIVADDRVVGSVGVFRLVNIYRYTAELGYYIAEPYWGKGIATEAVRQACAYIFDQTDILRLYAECFAHNAASCRVLENSGFQYEGLLRQNAVKNSTVLDMKIYGRLKADS